MKGDTWGRGLAVERQVGNALVIREVAGNKDRVIVDAVGANVFGVFLFAQGTPFFV